MAARPNIIFLMADQQKAPSLPAYGNPDTQSPHLDALASRGVLCERFYVNHPFCVPSRAAFLTGRYPQATGVHHNSHRLPAREVMVQDLLRDAGYRKGHEYDVPGFDVAFSEVGAHSRDSVLDPIRGNNVPNGPPASGRQTELSVMIRTPEWKYVHTPGREVQELYHLPADPWELHNRYGRAEYVTVISSLRERLLDWQLGHM
ncbi:MAG: sulfatase-like hydrolase/transferase [Chloroflexi bacterium]|nr:sulfatase-like hydrolase/transferase [Chloroflexota bacterium]